MTLPNRKMELSADQNHEASISSEPHVVIPCPSCRTKFAVEGSLVASFETPRFHCSRCDAIFELGNQTSKTHSDASRDQRWVLSDDDMSASKQPNLTNGAHSTLNTNDFSLGAVDSADSITHGVTERSGLSLLGWRFTSSSSSPAAITRQEALNRASLEALADTQTAPEPFSLFDPPSEPGKLSAAQRLPSQTNNAVQPNNGALTSKPEPRREASTEHRATVATQTKGANRQEPSSPLRSELETDRFSSRLMQRLSVRNRSLLILSAPVVALVLALLVVSYGSHIAPQTGDLVLSTITPRFISGSTASLPPPELSVREISLEFTKTQSRENIGVLRGIIQNSSQDQLDDVKIEALGFNARGEIIARSQAPLRSALARERISDLSLPTVKKFQESLSARSARIEPGERVSFTIAMLDSETNGAPQPLLPETLSQLRYFSARVFSVQR